MNGKITILLAVLCVSNIVFSQNTISGTIIDADDHQPLVGAVIQLQVSGAITVTDEQGNFQIISERKNDQAIIKYLGYGEMQVEITPNTSQIGKIEMIRA
nr:carboxypeptidase-like regulatory domain-containing protein [Saprospiraceae bacterium]